MANVMLENFSWFLFGRSPDVPAFKVLTLSMTSYFEWKFMKISSRLSNLNFAHSLYLHCLTNFVKKICRIFLVSVIMLKSSLQLERSVDTKFDLECL